MNFLMWQAPPGWDILNPDGDVVVQVRRGDQVLLQLQPIGPGIINFIEIAWLPVPVEPTSIEYTPGMFK